MGIIYAYAINEAPGAMPKKPKPIIPCPHCGRELKDKLPSLWASYRGKRPRPGAAGKKRPGVGGRPRKNPPEAQSQ
jgi:hypothetical protein